MSLDSTKDRIAKLLAVVASETAPQGEKDNAMMAAQILMDKHNLAADDCLHADKQFDDVFTKTTGKRVARWELYLTEFIKEVFGVSCYTARNSVHYYGRREPIEMASAMYDEMRHTIASRAKRQYGGWMKGDGGTYAEGFVTGLILSYRETKRLRCQTEAGNALVVQSDALVKKNALEAKDWLLANSDVKLSTYSASSGPRGSDDAFSRGVADGKKTNLSSYGGSQLKLT